MNTSTCFTKSLAVIPVMIATLATCPLSAQEMNYQGRLTDATGAPLADGQYTLIFSIHDAASGGSQIWGPFTADGASATPGHGPRAEVVNGRFNVALGPEDETNRQLSDSLSGVGGRYLELRIGANAPITPRQRMLHAPMAMTATNADHATNATNADHAADADHATSADHATNAVHASTAGTASSVGGADEIHYLNPPGMMAPFAGPSAPAGWFLCDGSAVKSSEYPGLYAAIGTAWGDGTNHQGTLEDPADPTTNFNLPDMRGVFPRGVSGSRNDGYADPDGAVERSIINVEVLSDSVAKLTVDSPVQFPATFQLSVNGFDPSSGILDGEYPATRIDDTTCQISGTGFLTGTYPGIPGIIRYGRTVGSIQTGRLSTHRHIWGYAGDESNGWYRTLKSYNEGGTLVNAFGGADAGAAGGTQDDQGFLFHVQSTNLYTRPDDQLIQPVGETRPNNAAVNYIIKY